MNTPVFANFLHLYQPAEQQPDILEAIVAQSYRPLIRFFKTHPKVRITLNINGSLLELFDKYGYRDLIEDLRSAGRDGRIEFTGSTKYHALLPFIDEYETVRQIRQNTETNTFYLGTSFRPRGFFPPEMAFRKGLAPLIEEQGFEWMILDEIACGGRTGNVDPTKVYRAKGTGLRIFFRERRTSNLIMSAVVRNAASLLKTLPQSPKPHYTITAMDGETFGHHRVGHEKFLFDLLLSKKFKTHTISDLLGMFHNEIEVSPASSTWASSERDIQQGIQFLSWHDPSNVIHAWQWKLFRLVLAEVRRATANRSLPAVRKKMDLALASDHFWWASAKPWWSLEMIEDGAFRLLETLRMIPRIPKKKLDLALHWYEKIVSTAHEWQRTGQLRKMIAQQHSMLRIPFKVRTFEKGGNERGVYEAFLFLLRRQERLAAKKREYEKAVLWRDALYKIENKLDIYEAVNAIDLLRLELPHNSIEKVLDRFTAKYKKIRGGQPEQRGA